MFYQQSSLASIPTRRGTTSGFVKNPWNHESLAWAAGFYDGEGCTSFHQKQNKRGSQISCGITQKYKDILQKFQKSIGGSGKIYITRNNFFMWRTGHFEDVQFVICLLWKWLSERKQKQAIQTLKLYHQNRNNMWVLQKSE
jgi:hypothetical protein